MTVLDLGTVRPAAQTLAQPTLAPGFAQGVVTGVVGNTVTLLVGASPLPVPGVPYLDSYFPTVGDTVVIGYFGDSPWVVGCLTPYANVAPTIVCTSTTRPASPAGGQMIYETDTDYVRAWNVSLGRWVIVNPPTFDDTAAGSSTTVSATYADLAAGAGPSVSCVTDTEAEVSFAAEITNSGTNSCWVAVAVSGATTIAAADANAIEHYVPVGTAIDRRGYTYRIPGLNPGTNVFTLKYRTSAGTFTGQKRYLLVRPG